jgi:hypothetical protein
MGAVLAQEQFSVAEAIGGWRGVLESAAPTVLFVALFVATRSIPVAAGAAGAAVLIALVVRLVQRQSPSTVLGGLLGVAIGAIWALRSGRGSDFYAPGIVINAVTLAILVISLIARRPLVGLVIGLLDPRVADWREDPRSRRAYTVATWVFAGLYASKLLVQVPLLVLHQVAALGAAKLAMGLPLFALVTWIVWMIHRSVLASRKDADGPGDPPDPRDPEDPAASGPLGVDGR